MASDDDIIGQIDALVAEERDLRSQPAHRLGDDERARLRALNNRLDQCWDLLRQRRAKTEFHENPDDAAARPVSEVESYRQ